MNNKIISKISKIVLIGTILLLVILLCGCAKKTDPLDTIAGAAHEQIVAIHESLPPECQTAAIEKQLKAHDETISSIVANCDTQKKALNSEKLRWQWAFFALAAVVGLYIARKIFKL